MANAIQRAAGRILGLPSPEEVQTLRNELRLSQNKRGASSGVDMTFGEYETEFNKNMRGTKKWETLEKMEADPHIKGALRTNSLPLQTAEWVMIPASEDPRDVEIAEFCASNLLRKSSETYGREYWIQTPWKAQRLPEILTMLLNGFSMFHESFRRVGSKLVYDKLHWIEPSTITRWQMNESDELISINRTYTKQTGKDFGAEYKYDITTPVDELKLYVWDMKGARYNGRSMVRSMYGPWFRKDFIQRVAVIWSQKVGSPVPIGVYPKGWTDDQVNRFDEFVQSTLGSAPDKAWGSFEMGEGDKSPKLSYVGAETGDIDRSTVLVDAENREISHAAGTKHAMLGETISGSRAMGDTLGMTDLMGVEAVAEIIAEQEQHGVGTVKGVIEKLVELNFSGVKKYPSLACPKVNPLERVSLIQNLVIPAVAAGLMPRHPDLSRQITDVSGFTLPDSAFENMDKPPEIPEATPDGVSNEAHISPPNRGGDRDAGGESDDEEASVEARALAAEDFRQRIAPMLQSAGGAPVSGGGFRAPNQLEATVCNLAAINATFDVGERDALNVLRETRTKMIAELMTRLRTGKINKRSIGSQRNSKSRWEKKAISALSDVLGSTGKQGIEHVNAEMAKQRGF